MSIDKAGAARIPPPATVLPPPPPPSTGRRDLRPFVAVDPAMKSGQPTVNGTRLTVAAVADYVWADGVDQAAADHDLTRGDVLVACWYAGTVGLPGRRKSLAPTPLWRRRWSAWADDVHQALWSVTTVDYDKIPDPPGSDRG
ncbi:DUF433 domain-containing protein [Dactylosporangium sp. CA-139066]|uniref:DUF433 domain-containing protein n=1 Tax=Dactylosporangium sp. CA-139066 TaxID=3239930 RepID=UPI003D914E7A